MIPLPVIEDFVHSTNCQRGWRAALRALCLVACGAIWSAPIAGYGQSAGLPMDETAHFQACGSGWCGPGTANDRVLIMGEAARLQSALPQMAIVPMNVHGFGQASGLVASAGEGDALLAVLSRADHVDGRPPTCRLAYDAGGSATSPAVEALARALVAMGEGDGEARRSAAAFIVARGVGECLDAIEREDFLASHDRTGTVPGDSGGSELPAVDGRGYDSAPVQFAYEEAIADAFGFLWCERIGCAKGLPVAVEDAGAQAPWGRLFHDPAVAVAVAKATGDVSASSIPDLWASARSAQKSIHENNLHVTHAINILYSTEVDSLAPGEGTPSEPASQRTVQPARKTAKPMGATAPFGGSGLGTVCRVVQDGVAQGCGGA